MNVNQAIDALLSITAVLFLEDSNRPIDREGNSILLKEWVEGTIRARGIGLDTKMNDMGYTDKRTKVYVFSVFSPSCLT